MGIYRNTKPIITELPLQVGLVVVAFTDGMITAGHRKGTKIDIPGELIRCTDEGFTAQQIADHLIELALELDDRRPIDDVSIVVLKVTPVRDDPVRRMSVTLPLK